MPNLTPIALTTEEHEKLTSLKHKLEANSWREMLMKLCDIYEDYSQTETNTQPEPEETITENPEPESMHAEAARALFFACTPVLEKLRWRQRMRIQVVRKKIGSG